LNCKKPAKTGRNLKKADKRVTLIELIIILAVIGILASITIPLFMACRQKGMNPAAGSSADIRGFSALQASARIARSASCSYSGGSPINAPGEQDFGE
jgi:Tfp pilus assembly protein FimT